MSLLLNNIYKSFVLSPSYFTGILLSTGLIASDVEKNKSPTIDSVTGTIFLIPSIAKTRINFYSYKRTVQLIQMYGYKERFFNCHLETFCGRQQVKLAAKVTGFVKNSFQKI